MQATHNFCQTIWEITIHCNKKQ